jgi:hypothetical protein
MATLARLIVVAICLSFCTMQARDIRTIDFANQVYTLPEIDPNAEPAFSRVSAETAGERIHLRGGKYVIADEDADFASAVLGPVLYGDVMRDGKTDAVVFIRLSTRGTQRRGLLLLYTMSGNNLRLADQYWTGDRASEGFRRMSIQRSDLFVELYVQEGASGDCCPTQAVRVHLQWRGNKLVEIDRSPPFVVPD